METLYALLWYMFGSAAHQAFALSLLGIVAFVWFLPRFATLARNIILRSARRGLVSTVQEAPKFALIRIALGIILTWRAYDLWVLLTPEDLASPILVVFAVLNLASGVALTLGLFTQFCLVFLMLVQWHGGDAALATLTLGNDVAGILACVLLLTQGGRLLSLDALIIRRWPRMRMLLGYYPTATSAETITLAKWLAVFCYWLVCVYSLSMHLNEPSWMNGSAGPLLLSNNFMSKPYELFIALFQNEMGVHLARLSLWLMLPWYLLLMPAILAGGYARLWVIIWGVLFFSLSKFVLSLGWLAEIEFLFWAALFWTRTGIAQTQRFAVAYDDTCNLCDRTVQFVRFMDRFERVELKPASKSKAWLKQHGISYERAMQDLHGVDTQTGRIYAGYDFYIALAWQVVLLWPVYPILLLGKWLGIGPVIYRLIAARRTAMFGVCKLPSAKRAPAVYVEDKPDRGQLRFVTIILLHGIFLGSFYLLKMPAPYVGVTGIHTNLADAAHLYGITPINVFNATDLRMAENWFTLSVDHDGKEELLPVMAADGSRLAYHRSDRVYFGHTLQFRRGTIDTKGCQFQAQRSVIDYLAKVHLARAQLPAGEYRFTYRQYFQPLPDSELLAQNRYVVQPTTVRCEKHFRLTQR